MLWWDSRACTCVPWYRRPEHVELRPPGEGEHFSCEHGNKQASRFTWACGLKSKQKQPFFSMPELLWVPQSDRFEPLQSYLVEIKAQFKKRVIDKWCESCVSFSPCLYTWGVAGWSSICPMRITQFHYIDHLDDRLVPEAWRYIEEQTVLELSAMSQTLCLTCIGNQLEWS